MQTLPEQFKGALTRIQVDPKIAIQTQVQVRAVLEANLELRRWGIDTVLIGSYSRGTGVHPGRDVDIFAKLTALDTSSNPSDVFNLVRDVLVDRYQDKASPQPRSIKIAVSDDFSADVVPAVRRGDDWAIPARDPELWGDPAKRWRTTNPEKLGALTTDRNKTPKVAGQGAYVPVVKLVRQTRRHHLGDLKPGGLYMELGCYRAFEDCVSFGDSYAEIFADTLRRVGDQLASGVVLADPALGTAYDPAPETSARAVAGERFHQLAAKAAAALQMDPCQAALGWRQILGDNPDGPCFPLPEGCDDQGRRIVGIGPVRSAGPDEARPFA